MSLQKDLTVGSIRKHVIMFSLPVLISNFLQALYNVVDSWYVGRYVGAAGLSAVTVSFPIMMIMISLVMGLGMGSTILIGQFSGRGDTQNVRETADTSIYIFAVMAVVVTISGLLLTRPLLLLLNTPADALEYAVQYLQIIFIGIPFVFGYNMLGGFQRGLGDSMTPLYFVAIATVINIVLDYVFIAKFNMAVAGAAWATIIAQGVSFALGVLYFRRRKHIIDFDFRRMRFHLDKLKKILKIGLPTSIQQALLSMSFAVFSSFVNVYGVAASAAVGIGSRMDNFAFLPAMSIGISVSSISAQNIGAGKPKRALSSAINGAVMASGICILMTALAMIFAPNIVSFFNTEPEVVRIGTMYIRTVSICYTFFAVMFSFNGLIQGSGNTMFAMGTSLITQYVVRIPLALLLSRTFGMGLHGLYIAIVFGPFVGMLANVGYTLTGRWKKKRVIQNASEDESAAAAMPIIIE